MSVQGVDQSAPWRRLSARMLLVHPVRELGQAIPALIGLVVAGRAIGDGQLWWMGPVAVVVVIMLSVLRWVTTTYRITAEQVQLRTGLLQRKTITTPTDRVRSVDVTASALHRLLGLAKVQIGTGSHDAGSGLSLDSLTVSAAAGLRTELLHRSVAAFPGTTMQALSPEMAAAGPVPDTTDTAKVPDGGVTAAVPDLTGRPPAAAGSAELADLTWGQETELARMDPRWVRFAPFTMSGVLGAVAVFGLGWRLVDQIGVNAADVGPVRGGLDYLRRTAIWLDVLQGLVGLVVLITLLSIGGYTLSYWGFRLTRHSRGSLQVTRGLLTTRAISIEERRLRGLELAEPLLLRAVHAAHVSGITTGLKARGGADGGSSMLLPPAPRAVAHEVVAHILRSPVPAEVALTAHGPAARRRRFVRTLAVSLVLNAVAAVAIISGAPLWLALPALATLPVAALLAADRYQSLGHAIAGDFLVTRAGSLYRRRDLLECDGIIGWNLRQTLFQRRVGLSTLTATTAAGRQRYSVTDVPLPMALSLADRALPGLLGEFLAPAPARST